MSNFTEFYDYTENLVWAQYTVSNIINHELTKGEVREEFVIDAIQKGFGNTINLKRGFLQVGDDQSNQMDILLLKRNAHVMNIGNQTIVHPDNCLMVLEVKGNATGTDMKEYNDKIAKVKAMEADSYPLFGLFCYKIKLTEKTIMNRFGFNYDGSTNSYLDEFNLANHISGSPIDYPNIDFIISIETDEADESKQVYMRRNEITGRYIRSADFPVMKNLYLLTRSLLMTDN